MKTKTTSVDIPQTDEQLIDEVVKRMRQRNEQFADAQNIMKNIREVFGARPQPRGLIQSVMQRFCAS